MPLVRRASPVPQAAPGAGGDDVLAELRGGSVQQRWVAARRLATRPDAVPALTEVLADEPEARVREAIFTSLARINTNESIATLLSYLRCNDANLRNGALDALKTISDIGQTTLPSLLTDNDADVRVLACDLAREMPSINTARLLGKVLDTDPTLNVCIAAIETLTEIGSPDDLPSLTRCAERFADQPFLLFAIKSATERLGSRPAPRNG